MQSSKRAARHDVKAAERLAALEATSEALAAGDIPQDHARLIARASSDGPIDEQALVDAAKEQTYDDFKNRMSWSSCSTWTSTGRLTPRSSGCVLWMAQMMRVGGQ